MHTELIHFTLQVLDQASALARAFDEEDEYRYASLVGPHLRHVIEHFDALADAAPQQYVNYDDRQREVALERQPRLALLRLQALRWRFASWPSDSLDVALEVRTIGGLAGEHRFHTPSTFARELVFLTSHAVHHFALLKPACVALGKDIAPHFGTAPATVAFERERRALVRQQLHLTSPSLN